MTTAKEVPRQKNIFSLNLIFLTIYGLWNPFQRKLPKRIYHIYSLLILLISIESFLLMYIDVIVNRHDINIIASSLPATITGTTNIIKIIYFLFKHETLVRVIKDLNKGLYPGETEPFLREEEIRAKRRSFNFTVLMIGAAILSALSSYVKTTIDVVGMDLTDLTINDTQTIMNNMRVRQWFPQSWYYKYPVFVLYSPLVGILSFSPPTDMGFDSLMAALYIHTTCQFELIQKRVFDFQDKHQIKDSERYSLLRKSLVFHQNSIRFVQVLQDLIGPFLFVQFLCSTIILGIGIFQFAILADTSQRLVLLPYMINMLFQLWFHSYFGEQLSTQSENIANEAYLTDWDKYPNKYKYGVSILMLRAQKPLRLNAGKFYILSVDTFRNIMSASFSYYTLLKEMN